MQYTEMVRQTGDKVVSAINYLIQQGYEDRLQGLSDRQLVRWALGEQRTQMTGELWF